MKITEEIKEIEISQEGEVKINTEKVETITEETLETPLKEGEPMIKEEEAEKRWQTQLWWK